MQPLSEHRFTVSALRGEFTTDSMFNVSPPPAEITSISRERRVPESSTRQPQNPLRLLLPHFHSAAWVSHAKQVDNEMFQIHRRGRWEGQGGAGSTINSEVKRAERSRNMNSCLNLKWKIQRAQKLKKIKIYCFIFSLIWFLFGFFSNLQPMNAFHRTYWHQTF